MALDARTVAELSLGFCVVMAVHQTDTTLCLPLHLSVLVSPTEQHTSRFTSYTKFRLQQPTRFIDYDTINFVYRHKG